LLATVLAALAFNVVAGFNDGGNLLAAAAASRTIPVRVAYALILACVFAGPLVLGWAVATTIGSGIGDYAKVGNAWLLTAVIASLCAVLLAYVHRIPTPMSLALVSAMVGSLWVGPGLDVVRWDGVAKVAIASVGAPLAGFSFGALAFVTLQFLLRPATRQTGDRVMMLQYGSAGLQALAYGANDAEKAIGLILAAAAITGPGAWLGVPLHTIAVCTLAFGFGMAVGGARVAKTIGGKIFTIRPEHALAFQTAAGSTVLVSSLAGAPLSTTQTTAAAIVGVGTAVNRRGVHWAIARRIVLTWFMTVPAGLAAGIVGGEIARWLGA
jgi:inorganic phosphate transporter, PiT family